MLSDEHSDHFEEFQKLTDDLVKGFEDQMYETVMGHWNERDTFIANLSGRWWKGFVAYEAMYLLTIEMAKGHVEKAGIKNKDSVSYGTKFFALMNIHGRACQVFLEILCLLKNGFADGAFARWRSLFELSVYAKFIQQNSEIVATAYIEQAETEEKNAKWAKSADCFQQVKGNVTFRLIFENCGFSDETRELWQKQYELASKTVHASPQGTMKRLANAGSHNNFIAAGSSDWGLHVPAEHAAISFHHISAIFFSEPEPLDGMVATTLLSKWVDVVRRHLYETVGTCFPEVEEATEIYNEYLKICKQESDNKSN